MAYSAEISRSNPSCFLFLIDQSGSMADPFPADPGKRKADGVADAINRLLQNLVIKCAKAEGVRDYYYVGVIGYGEKTGPAFGGPLAGQELVPISQVADSPVRIEERTKKVDDGAGGLVEQKVKFPIWFDAVANKGTPMREAFTIADRVLSQFLGAHPNCFPPVVINITDGESTDGDPSDLMKQTMALSSSDGNVLVFNLNISGKQGPPIAFPNTNAGLPDQYAQVMFDNSSELTAFMQSVAKEQGFSVQPGAKGFVFNGDLTLVIQALDIGTRPSNLR